MSDFEEYLNSHTQKVKGIGDVVKVEDVKIAAELAVKDFAKLLQGRKESVIDELLEREVLRWI